ncbi:Phosphatidylinositol transfer protein CSR1 [Candida viswanathii]|uniref:Phosphatidylinositol transfer protein CSR1 n=1 Tax=Candida viswanathii TaxID=5486 RepID=A0A367YNQ8_9ASCO|nr:Phosphatidylinositol transfer protein CSR1 [Candida viswanathii]
MTSENVKYRLQRIQTLNGEQEVTLKQVWAYCLKFYGYPVDISDQDVAYKQCFVASTSTANFDESQAIPTLGLTKTNTRGSINSSTSTASKKKRGLFGSKKSTASAMNASVSNQATGTPPANSKRMMQIQSQSSSERYIPVDKPGHEYYAIFAHHFKASYEYSDDYDPSLESGAGGLGAGAGAYSNGNGYYGNDDAASINSLETFVTASTSLTDYDDLPALIFKNNGRSNGNSYGGRIGHPGKQHHQPQQLGGGAGGLSLHEATLNTPINVHPGRSPIPLLQTLNVKEQHTALTRVPRNDLIDNLLLRFIRARKWDSEKAIEMMFKSLQWRSTEFPADIWAMEGDAPSYLNGTNKGFVHNFTTEKSWIKGRDKNNNPIFMFQAKKHFTADAPLEQNQRYAIVTIEWVRLFLREVSESVDTCTIVFDLTGFSLKNADYSTIKFLADVFEAHYPETLGFILIHNAPWIFSTVWNIIKGWLDPVVASKIHFTKDAKELSKFIDPTLIPDYLGGEDTTRGFYPIPEPKDEFPPKKKDAEFVRLRRERDELYVRFLETTRKWIESTNPQVSEKYLRDKIDLNVAISKNYLQLDPYIRNAGIYDRDGTLTVGH